MTQPTDIRRDHNGAQPLFLDAALAVAGRGWPVFPLRPRSKAPALHRQDRCPETGVCAGGHVKWEQRATTDPAIITRCWSHKPYNIGLATGPAGLIVIDLDMPKANSSQDAPGGADNLLALCERAGQPVPATLTVRTPPAGPTCTSPPRRVSGSGTPRASWRRSSTPAPTADTSSPPAAPRRPASTK